MYWLDPRITLGEQASEGGIPMCCRRTLSVALIFLAGFVCARFATPTRPIDTSVLEGPLVIYPCDAPGEVFQLKPTRICVDRVRRPLSEPPLGRAPVYRIDAAGGRVVLYATREPMT